MLTTAAQNLNVSIYYADSGKINPKSPAFPQLTHCPLCMQSEETECFSIFLLSHIIYLLLLSCAL